MRTVGDVFSAEQLLHYRSHVMLCRGCRQLVRIDLPRSKVRSVIAPELTPRGKSGYGA